LERMRNMRRFALAMITTLTATLVMVSMASAEPANPANCVPPEHYEDYHFCTGGEGSGETRGGGGSYFLVRTDAPPGEGGTVIEGHSAGGGGGYNGDQLDGGPGGYGARCDVANGECVGSLERYNR
jgi:hypothetical protein